MKCASVVFFCAYQPEGGASGSCYVYAENKRVRESEASHLLLLALFCYAIWLIKEFFILERLCIASYQGYKLATRYFILEDGMFLLFAMSWRTSYTILTRDYGCSRIICLLMVILEMHG